jgi:hypothetical protein
VVAEFGIALLITGWLWLGILAGCVFLSVKGLFTMRELKTGLMLGLISIAVGLLMMWMGC